MKKTLICVLMIVCLFSIFSIFSYVSATDNNVATQEESTVGKLVDLKDKEEKELADYVEAYGSEAYGFTAYLLGKIRLYSIPLCFVGIAVGAIFQYVIGIRKLDVRDKGFGLIIAFVTILVICQVLPLIFAIVVKGWRS